MCDELVSCAEFRANLTPVPNSVPNSVPNWVPNSKGRYPQ